ncbi:hypothetical protein F5141DRAFT_460272 [Pisolithus sp. B1]|nr:hypothetical protein F5141DRAFT_460272 [Pisolithus sp. B1]
MSRATYPVAAGQNISKRPITSRSHDTCNIAKLGSPGELQDICNTVDGACDGWDLGTTMSVNSESWILILSISTLVTPIYGTKFTFHSEDEPRYRPFLWWYSLLEYFVVVMHVLFVSRTAVVTPLNMSIEPRLLFDLFRKTLLSITS